MTKHKVVRVLNTVAGKETLKCLNDLLDDGWLISSSTNENSNHGGVLYTIFKKLKEIKNE